MALFDTDDGKFNEMISRVIKVGEVSSVNPVAGTARVVFDDEDSVVSYDLPVLQRNTIANRDYAMPDIGEDVLCVFLPTGEEDGFILGSFYAEEIAPPVSDIDIRMVEFSDGTKISYDRASSTLTATVGGTEIKADPQTVDVTGTQTVNINGGASINLTAPVLTLTMGGTTMTLTGSNAVIDTTDITFTGNMEVTGDLAVNGKIQATGTVHGSNI